MDPGETDRRQSKGRPRSKGKVPKGGPSAPTFDEVVQSHEDGGSYFVNQKVNYYTFKTDMQDKMLDLVKPCIEKQLEDRLAVADLQLYFNKLSKRV